ncbi:LysM peptidoglycan-binding domain-containing protein [Anaerocolumna aminovalerica]|uniref:LysM peptidoglycan-binding domain-containing protein n=1 Tax=Anaerocolumna aminovalerica TaxID=1527 RepID=UPI001C0E9A4C|nr:LysM peptidoglycan-binding domain-containing protein [Anaerocolumna aminovalerica]MBU5330839.1 LysM peptidoglycan-binding domain-containing protein [Anaerocolumna aminovalerica]
MDNGHINTHNGKKPDDTMYSGIYKLPKNIRQIGNIPIHNKIIYVEDYVMTFMKQIGQKEPANCSIAVLLGYFVRTEERKHIFIKGAVEMKQNDFYNGITFTDECWTSIYEDIKKYFMDVEIVGWALTGSGFYLDSEEMLRKVHMENFNGPDKTLLKIDTLEREEVFYLLENNQLVKQSGYYIYYEKNEEMQNYMIDAKNVVSEESNYEDHTTQRIRNVIQEKNEQKQLKVDDKSVIRLLYSASTLLAVIVLVIAGTMLNNYKKMRDMEEALYAISENLNQNKSGNNKENVKGTDLDEIKEVSNFGSKEKEEEKKGNEDDTSNMGETTKGSTEKETTNTQGTNSQSDTVEVETIPGDVTGEEEQKQENNMEKESKGKDLETPNSEKENKEQSKKEPTPKPTEEPTKEPTPKPTKEAEKEKPEESKETAKEVRYYVVQSGESLAGICYKLYNSANYMSKIKELNGIEDENKIYAGQKLIVP